MSLNSAEQCEAAVAQVATLTAENARLRRELAASDAGWKAEADHRNAGWKEAEKLCADLARVTGERDGLLAAARAVFSTWICLRDAGRLVPRGLEYGCESLGNAIAACAALAKLEQERP